MIKGNMDCIRMLYLLWFSLFHIFLACGDEDASSAIIAYDCSNHSPNFTVLNLNQVGACSHITNDIISISKEIQLIEIVDDIRLPVYHCQVIVNRVIWNCGMHSHSSIVKNGYMSYPVPISEQKCKDMMKHGEYCLYCNTPMQKIIRDLKVGTSRRIPMTFAGTVNEIGTCQGESYADLFGSWKGVVVEGYVQITTSILEAMVTSSTNVIHLQGKLTCQYSQKSCQDDVSGNYFWELISEDSCRSSNHKVLYEGPANFTYEQVSQNIKNDLSQGIVTVSSDSILFSLQLLGRHEICNLRAYKTEHPKLIIVEKVGAYFYFVQGPKNSNGMDLFTYFNSKFVYIERNIKSNMESLYQSIHYQRCELEMLTLKLNLALASSDPVEFGYIFGGGPGYVGTKVGEAVYVSKCQPVFVSLRKVNKCYHELPVLYQNSSYFRTPKTHLLQNYGSEVTCNTIFPPLHYVMETWYKVMGGYSETIPPQVLRPSSAITWRYKDITNLAKAGIYSQHDLNSLRSHIMYGNERVAIETVLTRSAQGYNPDLQGLDMSNLLDEDTMEKLGKKFGEKMWDYFTIFGNISSGIIGLFFTLKTLKWLTNLIISGALLYEIYGWSYKLLGCFFEALTSWLIHKQSKKDKPSPSQNNGPETLQLTSIEITPSEVQPTCPYQDPSADKGSASSQMNIYPSLKIQPGI